MLPSSSFFSSDGKPYASLKFSMQIDCEFKLTEARLSVSAMMFENGSLFSC